ncbi:MAG TPA: glycoside hydrolase domain-containing protein [Acidobacteriaceae bacterium]|nr:glycoside hydrolase domain-containing protein [Acidobacteriaceae bacterium]
MTRRWRGTRVAVLMAIAGLAFSGLSVCAQQSWIGFDKNGYPGDDLLPALHRTFAFSGYWLNNPPGMQSNPWTGKREVLRRAGFGFLLLFNGRLYANLKGQDAAALGRVDAAAAIAAARKEGFPAGAVIFLDQEEGGQLLPEQASYIGAWLEGIRKSQYRAGVYCSGVPVGQGGGGMSTAQDVAQRFPGAKLWFWDDRCPPAPGCTIPQKNFRAPSSDFPHALAWQYAKSPREPELTSGCGATYAPDGQCYAPNLPHSAATFIDMDWSSSPDPSRGR